jgi:hypothetical protein
MTLIPQHQEEEHFARTLFSALGIGPVQALRRGAPAPDIIATLPGQTIALEITELFQPSADVVVPHQGTEEYRAKVLERADSDWRNRGGPIVEAHVFFDPSATISKHRIAALAARLCDAVEQALTPDSDSANLEFDWERSDTYLPEEIAAVHVLRLPDANRSHWLSPDAGYVCALDRTMLQGVIDRKSHADYTEPGAESWLLVVVDGRRISASFDFPPDVVHHQYRSPFDRVFLLDMFSARARELSPE